MQVIHKQLQTTYLRNQLKENLYVIIPSYKNVSFSTFSTLSNTSKEDTLLSLCKRRGFAYQGSELYGGGAAGFDYGPLGSLLKRNIETAWWSDFVERRHNVVGLDTAIIQNARLWQASGHVDTFSDPLVHCQSCNARLRADHCVDLGCYENDTNISEERSFNNDTIQRLTDALTKNNFKCPMCGATGQTNGVSSPRNFNLLFETQIGALHDESNRTYLRPETAQGVYTQFHNVCTTSRQKLPFGIAQIGKAFRNEIRVSHFVFRTREFEQCELQWFSHPTNANDWMKYWVHHSHEWLLDHGIQAGNLRQKEIATKDLAHYSNGTVDLEYNFSFGWGELWGIANRGSYDLERHAKASGHDLRYVDAEHGHKKYYPTVIEPSVGLNRLWLAFLTDALTIENAMEAGGKQSTRTVLKLHPRFAPIKLALLPLSKKQVLMDISTDLLTRLSRFCRVEMDTSGSIGKRYRRQDEAGTPYCITIDFDSSNDQCVTLRDRDSMTQERVSITELIQAVEHATPTFERYNHLNDLFRLKQ